MRTMNTQLYPSTNSDLLIQENDSRLTIIVNYRERDSDGHTTMILTEHVSVSHDDGLDDFHSICAFASIVAKVDVPACLHIHEQEHNVNPFYVRESGKMVFLSACDL